MFLIVKAMYFSIPTHTGNSAHTHNYVFEGTHEVHQKSCACVHVCVFYTNLNAHMHQIPTSMDLYQQVATVTLVFCWRLIYRFLLPKLNQQMDSKHIWQHGTFSPLPPHFLTLHIKWSGIRHQFLTLLWKKCNWMKWMKKQEKTKLYDLFQLFLCRWNQRPYLIPFNEVASVPQRVRDGGRLEFQCMDPRLSARHGFTHTSTHTLSHSLTGDAQSQTLGCCISVMSEPKLLRSQERMLGCSSILSSSDSVSLLLWSLFFFYFSPSSAHFSFFLLGVSFLTPLCSYPSLRSTPPFSSVGAASHRETDWNRCLRGRQDTCVCVCVPGSACACMRCLHKLTHRRHAHNGSFPQMGEGWERESGSDRKIARKKEDSGRDGGKGEEEGKKKYRRIKS